MRLALPPGANVNVHHVPFSARSLRHASTLAAILHVAHAQQPRCEAFAVEGGSVVWPNGADIAPETLYEQARSARKKRLPAVERRKGKHAKRS